MPARKKGNFFSAFADEGPRPGGGKAGKRKKKAQKPKDPEVQELRRLRKKFREIESLEMSMAKLNPDQKKKISQKQEVAARVGALEAKHPECKQQQPQPRANVKLSTQPTKKTFKLRFKPQEGWANEKDYESPHAASTSVHPTPKARPRIVQPRPAMPVAGTTVLKNAISPRKDAPKSQPENADSWTARKRRIKTLKKKLKGMDKAARNASLGLASIKDQEVLENKETFAKELERLRISVQEMVLSGRITPAEKKTMMENIKKKVNQCNSVESKLMGGGSLTAEEEKLLSKKTKFLKEFSELQKITPKLKDKIQVSAPPRQRLCDFPEELQVKLVKIDHQISVSKNALKEIEELESRFGKRGGKPLSMDEIKKINRKESHRNKIAKLEEEQRKLFQPA